MPCNHCHRPYGDAPDHCRHPDTWACKDAQIARLTAKVAELEALANFGRAVLTQHRCYDADGNANPGDCDGDWLEERAVECGLLVWRDGELFEVTP